MNATSIDNGITEPHDQAGANVAQKQEQHHGDQHGAFDQVVGSPC